MPNLVEDWKDWHRFWCNRMMVLASVVQLVALLADVGSDYVSDWRLRIAIGVAGIICTLAGIYARLLFQRSLHGSKPETDA